MYRTASRTELEKAVGRFLAAERSMLEQRRRGSLARALGDPLPDESPEELQWLVIEDRHLAEGGIVELRSGEEAWFKHVDDLTYEDRPARVEAENTRRAWLMERLVKEAEARWTATNPGAGRLPPEAVRVRTAPSANRGIGLQVSGLRTF